MIYTFDEICTSMDKFHSDMSIQMQCINCMFPILKDRKNTESLVEFLNRINNALNTFNDNLELQESCLTLFEKVITHNYIFSILAKTDFTSLVLFILYRQRDNGDVTLRTLKIILKLLQHSPLLQFLRQNTMFLDNLSYVSRINNKSSSHAYVILEIIDYLNPVGNIDFCNTILSFSRNTEFSEPLQSILIKKFVKLADESVYAHIGSSSLSHFFHIVYSFPGNIDILTESICIFSKVEYDFPPKIISIIISNWPEIQKKYNSVCIITEVLAMKLQPNDIPPSLVFISNSALQILIPDSRRIRFAMRLCYNSVLATSQTEPGLVSTLTSVLNYHMANKSVVKQFCIILLQLLKSQSYTDKFAPAATLPCIMFAIQLYKDDEKIIELLATLLLECVKSSSKLITQMNRQEFIDALIIIVNKYLNNVKILYSVLSILQELVINLYGLFDFLDLPMDKKSKFLIETNVCATIIEKYSVNVGLVRPSLLLMKDNSSVSGLYEKMMKLHKTDQIIQICGLAIGIKDIILLSDALTLCGVNALRFSIPSLLIATDPFPQNLVNFLISCDRKDTADILNREFDRGNIQCISSQFELKFAQHLPLAMRLSKSCLWKISGKYTNLVLTTLEYESFDKEIIAAALYFSEILNVTEDALPILINLIRKFPEDRNIVKYSARCIIKFEPSVDLERELSIYNIISMVAYALELHKDDDESVYTLLKLLHLISYFDSLQCYFLNGLFIPIIVNVSQKSPRCSNVSCCIFANICHNSEIAEILHEFHVENVAFQEFSHASYELISKLIELTEYRMTHNEFSALYKNFCSSKSRLTEEDTLYLMSSLYSYLSTSNKLPKIDSKDFVHQLNLFSSNADIVILILRILYYTKNFAQDQSLLFLLLDLMEIHFENMEVIECSFKVLQAFTKMDVYKSYFLSDRTCEVLLNVYTSYGGDPTISNIIFIILHGRIEVVSPAIQALHNLTDEVPCVTIASALLSVASKIELKPYIKSIFNLYKIHEKSEEICISLIHILFLGSESKNNIPYYIKNIQILADNCVRHASSVAIVRSTIGIISNISNIEKYVASINVSGPLVTLALKNLYSDKQTLTYSLNIVYNLSIHGRSKLFKHTSPFLCMTIKSQPNNNELLSVIQSMAPELGEYSNSVANILVKSIIKANNSENMVKSLEVVSQYCNIENAIFEHIEQLFEIVFEEDIDEKTASCILNCCASVNDPIKLEKYESYVLPLTKRFKNGRKSSQAAGAVLLKLATYRPKSIEDFVDDIKISTKDPELLKISRDICRKI